MIEPTNQVPDNFLWVQLIGILYFILIIIFTSVILHFGVPIEMSMIVSLVIGGILFKPFWFLINKYYPDK